MKLIVLQNRIDNQSGNNDNENEYRFMKEEQENLYKLESKGAGIRAKAFWRWK